MHLLALEPYYTGSHRAFIDGWRRYSRHQWTVLGLPGYKWKWRMRHAPITLATQAGDIERPVDALFCSDMLDLAGFRGLAPPALRSLPTVAYFHENQLTYPATRPDTRDYHFAMTNFTTALAADAVWFNSDFHRRTFLDAMEQFLTRMPDFQPLSQLQEIQRKSSLQPQGIEPMPARTGDRRPGPLRILWAARWEHDKNFEDFYEGMTILHKRGRPFRVSVIGEKFSDVPAVFERARAALADRIDRWGWLDSREEYVRALGDADIIVSTALHEFFGVSVVEAIAAGARPLLPKRLAYPEILGEGSDAYFYDGTVEELVNRLTELIEQCERTGSVWSESPDRLSRQMERFTWPLLAPTLDDTFEAALAPSR